jgi:endogenous inhibitor of DNA gyrase (YacG/DUF329 family)
MPSPSAKCPACGRRYRPDPGSAFRPFCSERCQLIDLGGWLSERHAIPGEATEVPADSKPSGEDA